MNRTVTIIFLILLFCVKVIESMSPSTLMSICGKRIHHPNKRIVGGRAAEFLNWPWMVSLRANGLHKCGAVLINEFWIATAAHCVYKNHVRDLTVRLGEHDAGHNNMDFPHTERQLLLVVTHPEYDPVTDENDLALLRVYRKVRFQEHIIPICIPTHNKSYAYDWATAAGWGKVDDGRYPRVLQKVELPILTNRGCMKMFRKAGFEEWIPRTFICAGLPEGGRDSCRGDSGGPLALEENDQWYLIGITSWGNGCAEPNQPGVYTRITEYWEWISIISRI